MKREFAKVTTINIATQNVRNAHVLRSPAISSYYVHQPNHARFTDLPLVQLGGFELAVDPPDRRRQASGLIRGDMKNEI